MSLVEEVWMEDNVDLFNLSIGLNNCLVEIALNLSLTSWPNVS